MLHRAVFAEASGCGMIVGTRTPGPCLPEKELPMRIQTLGRWVGCLAAAAILGIGSLLGAATASADEVGTDVADETTSESSSTEGESIEGSEWQ
jgi:hypothetical protein